MVKTKDPLKCQDERTHEKGVAEFGATWLPANIKTVQLAQRGGLDVSRLAIKEMLALITLHAMYAGRASGQQADDQKGI